MIDALFGSKTRVKLLHLFLNNPGQAFYVREITRKIDEQINSVRRELSNMMNVGIVLSDSVENKLYYEVNQSYEFYIPLRAIFADDFSMEIPAMSGSSEDTSQLEKTIRSLKGVRVALTAGALVPGSTANIELLLVGSLDSTKTAKIVSGLERDLAIAIRYAVLPYDEFYYRLSIRDRFITDIINSQHATIIDDDNIVHA